MATKVMLYGGVPDDMTEEDVTHLLKSNNLAEAKDIQAIELLRGVKQAIITLYDPEGKWCFKCCSVLCCFSLLYR